MKLMKEATIGKLLEMQTTVNKYGEILKEDNNGDLNLNCEVSMFNELKRHTDDFVKELVISFMAKELLEFSLKVVGLSWKTRFDVSSIYEEVFDDTTLAQLLAEANKRATDWQMFDLAKEEEE